MNWGNPDANYYSLARTEYGSTGSSTCNSDLGNGVATTCVFYDVRSGDMDMPCTGKINCYKPSGTYGVLSSSAPSYLPTYSAGKGWDFATGIGTPNVRVLLNQMVSGLKATFTAPTAGATLPSTTYTFAWTPGRNVAYYQLWIGTSAGAHNIYNGSQTSLHSLTLSGLPSNGETLYLTLRSSVENAIQTSAITVKAFTVAGAPVQGSLAPQ
jgi:hypothetical protein